MQISIELEDKDVGSLLPEVDDSDLEHFAEIVRSAIYNPTLSEKTRTFARFLANSLIYPLTKAGVEDENGRS